MGRTYDAIDDSLARFLGDQPVFFVATAPLAAGGHVNLSPKGLRGTFAVLGPTTVAYLDLTGSGAETIAHVQENGRITLMFCSFQGRPRIVRLSGHGRVVALGDPEYDELESRFTPPPGARAIIVVELERIADSCGYGVPQMTLVGDRDDLPRWTLRKGPEGVISYRREHNAMSIDGLPALQPVVENATDA